MPKIIELKQHVADLIAAGEVVRRPASVVKELLENSIDAGSTIITVEISSGGMSLIRVADNGCGIDPVDAKTAFLRHATSKLHSAEDLEAISTLGFRGEALAAISAVSRVELLTREPQSDEGISLKLEGGEIIFEAPTGCPEGTSLTVRDLFFNTPARFKFMKSDRAEASAVATVVLRAALSRPDISFRFIKDGVVQYHTPGDSRVDSCIYSLLGRDFMAGLISAESSDKVVSVRGYVSAPTAHRGNRSYQFFFVNGRAIRSSLLQTALEKAYENIFARGRFPACVLYIETKHSDVDVNVHPEKAEVKFVSDKQVFDGVYYSTLGALESYSNNDITTKFTSRNDNLFGNAGTDNFSKVDTSETASKLPNSTPDKSPNLTSRETYSSNDFDTSDPGRIEDFRPSYLGGIKKLYDESVSFSSSSESSLSNTSLSNDYGAHIDDNFHNTSHQLSMVNPHFRIIGQALNLYIILEYNDCVWLIDKHAAHERIHFDALKNGDYEPMSETLLTPVTCRLGHEAVSVLLDNAELLDKLGFSLDSFGEDSVAVRSIPSDINISDVEWVISELSAHFMRGGSSRAASQTELDNIFKTVSCKAAIKAGSSSDIRELESLAEKVISGTVTHCPHGRPVAFELSKKMLDKGFDRL